MLHGTGITVVETGSGLLEVDGGKPEHIGELAAQHQIVLHELSPQQASLEEAFMQLTAESVEYHAHADTPHPQTSQPQPPPPAPHWGDDWKRD